MYKRIGVLLILITVLLAGCSSSYVSDKEIISDENSYTYRKCNDTGSTSNSLNRAFEGFDGKDTIWMLDVENKASITVKISTTLDKGKFKVLLVSKPFTCFPLCGENRIVPCQSNNHSPNTFSL